MTLSLRQRRRLETACDIQKATLELAVLHGLDNITTEEISAAAGISARTFFNYYSNKETAAIGLPPGFREEDKAALRAGTASLAVDLKQFLDQHVNTLASDESALRMVRKIVHANDKARGILDGFLNKECEELTDCLCDRVNNRQVAAALANSATNATARAIYLWEQEEGLSLGASLDIIWEGLIEAARLLAASSD